MKLDLLPWLAVGTMILAGCSSTPTKVDAGRIRARTFSFVNVGPQATPTFADNRQAVHQLIQHDITENLAAKGVTRSDSGGDVIVKYLVIVGNNATTTTINDYFGYDDAASDLHDKAQKAYTSNKNPNYFEAGTLVIDIVDSRNFKLLKRGYATRPLLRNLPIEARATRLQEVVDEILRDVRFVP